MADRIDLDALEALRTSALEQVRTSSRRDKWLDWTLAIQSAAPALIAELRRLRKIEDAARKVSKSSVLAMEDALEQLDEAVKEWDEMPGARA